MLAHRNSRPKRWRALAVLASAVLIVLPIDARSAPVPPRPHASSGVDANTIFLRLRNEALGTWLPRGEDLFEPWHRRRAAVGALGWGDLFIVPRDGTPFWYGKTAPRVLAVYDPVRRVALYQQSCCGWQETVLARAAPPPRAVTTANLGALRSRRGIGLGASPSAVRRAHGWAHLYPSTTTRGLRLLSYYRDHRSKWASCEWFENFVFRANSLVEIQAGHGC